jgi:hypothetical protein
MSCVLRSDRAGDSLNFSILLSVLKIQFIPLSECNISVRHRKRTKVSERSLRVTNGNEVRFDADFASEANASERSAAKGACEGRDLNHGRFARHARFTP